MTDEPSAEALDLAARAMAKGAAQHMLYDFDDADAEDHRTWWRARAGDAYRAYTSTIEAHAARKVAEEKARCALIAFDRQMDISSDFDEGYDAAAKDIYRLITEGEWPHD